jgi:hypothetical protein
MRRTEVESAYDAVAADLYGVGRQAGPGVTYSPNVCWISLAHSIGVARRVSTSRS